MPTPAVQWKIQNDNSPPSAGDCAVCSYPGAQSTVELHNVCASGATCYEPRFNGAPVAELTVVFLDDSLSEFTLIFETNEFTAGPLTIDQAHFVSSGANPVENAKCEWAITNGSATAPSRITLTVGNHKVNGGEVRWTLGKIPGSPGAKLVLTVKRQDAAISCT